MFSFVGFILIVVLVILLFGLSLIGNFVRAIFGLGRRPNPEQQSQNHHKRAHTHQTGKETITDPQSKDRKKVFDKNEGEYVEFEEVDEEEGE